jgi:hypothetical protein
MTRVHSRVTSRNIHGGRNVTEEGFSEFLGFSLLIVISPLILTNLSPLHEMCDSPDQAAHYHTLSPKFETSFLSRHVAGLGVMVIESVICKTT